MQRSVKPYQAGSTPALRTMIGIILDTILVFFGGLVGLKLGKIIPERVHHGLMNIFGVIVIFIGIQMALETKNLIIVFISLIIGVIFGELINLERKVNSIVSIVLKRFLNNHNKLLSEALVTSFLIFCGGPMTILGTIKAGLSGDNQILFIKSILDGATAIPLAMSLGVGVVASTPLVFFFQLILFILSGFLKNILVPSIIIKMTAVAGLIILTIGLNILEIKKLKTINILPSVVFVIIFQSLINIFVK